MKNKFLYIVVVITTWTCYSCRKELNQTPATSKELNNFLQNETEVEEYVNATYASLQATGLYGLYLPAIGEIPSDNTYDEVPANDGGMYGQLDEFATIPTNEIITVIWRHSYQTIQKANVVLNRVEAITYKVDSVRQARKGEMKFIRALMYFNLVRLYGNVPLVTKETTNPNEYFGQGRTSKDTVYAQIRKDLEEAITVLPATVTQAGRVTKTAAQSLLARVHLTLNNYADARTLLQAVVASGKHALIANPADVFSITNENNKEIIFAVQFASGINGNTEGSNMFQQFSPSGTQSGAKGHNLPTKGLYNLYTATDRRKNVYVKLTAAGIPYNNKLTKPTTVITDGGSDIVVLRYADVLLMLAEVENKLDNTANAATYLNLVRTRAGLDNTTATTQAALANAIEQERRLELAGEGHRWFDLLRTGTAIDTMNAWFIANGINVTINKFDLLMPVPQGQRDTDPSISQNDGYN